MFIVIEYRDESTNMHGFFNEEPALKKMAALSQKEKVNAVMIDTEKCEWASSLTLKSIARA